MIIRLDRQFGLGLILAACGLVAGWFAGQGRNVHADDTAPLIDVKSIEGNSSLILYYPGEKKIFIYNAPFVGGPKSACAYVFTLTSPGGPISRQNCGTL
ncbi:MAG: hypothetical protein JOY62_07990 [Acidobacteriaceae bacterium]|nr:hypothetical protein [Acidobacteriaceae bacterium]MBV9779901.1 hypothetical protein [Acidobacteriaceae bacterium]